MSQSNLDLTQKLNTSLIDMEGKYLSQSLIERLNLNDNKIVTSSGFTIYKPQPKLVKQQDKYNSVFKINQNNSLDQSFMGINDSQPKTFQQVDQFRHQVLNSSFRTVKNEQNRSQNYEVTGDVSKTLNQISETQTNSAEKMDRILATLLQLDEQIKINFTKTDKFEIQLNLFSQMLSNQNVNIDERLNTVLHKIRKQLEEKTQVFHALAKDISDAKHLIQKKEEEWEKKFEDYFAEIQNDFNQKFDELAKKIENDNISLRNKIVHLDKPPENSKKPKIKISKNILEKYKIKSNITKKKTAKSDALNGVKNYIKNVSNSSSMMTDSSLDNIEDMEGVEFKNLDSTFSNSSNLRAKRVLNGFSYQEKSTSFSKRSDTTGSNSQLSLDSNDTETEDQFDFLDMI